MSRCHPFPPPGYVKNAPVELELSSKKDKHKHKDKKKKRKRHSATNDDLAVTGLPECDQYCTSRKQSSQPFEELNLPSATIDQSTVESLQTTSFVDETSLNDGLTTSTDYEQRFCQSRDKTWPRNALLATKKFQADSFHSLSTNVSSKDSCKRFQGLNPATERLQNGCLAITSKRLKLDSSTSLTNGVPVLSDCKRPEEAEKSESMNSVLSTKRKRLRAENTIFLDSNSLLPPNDATTSDCKKSDALQTGRFRTELLMQNGTDNIAVLSCYSDNVQISKSGPPSDFRKSEKRVRAGQSRSKKGKNVPCSSDCHAENVKSVEVPHSLLTNRCDPENATLEIEVQSNGGKATNARQKQLNSSNSRKQLTGKLTTNGDRLMQVEKLAITNCLWTSRITDSPAKMLNELFSGSSAARMLEEPEIRLENIGKSSPDAFVNTRDKLSELECIEQEVGAHDARVASKEFLYINSGRQDMKAEIDKISDRGEKPVNSYGLHDPRLQVDAFGNGITSNGVLGHNQHGKEHVNLPTMASAVKSESQSKAIHPPTVSSNFDDNLMKEKLSNLRIPQAEQAWVTTTENEDWLLSSYQQLKLKQGEENGRADSQQVWADAVLLPTVGLTALPFVVLS